MELAGTEGVSSVSGIIGGPRRGVWESSNLWEQEYYNYGTNGCSDGCGHYTQLVWSSTERVGCAFDNCADGSEIWMCTYDPPGNVVGEKPY
ncbi:MAG: hypothetical protein HN348_14865 [Proteobacteria bacterium]|nr:hypothetical protein [Pseudomonadota bacterium]